MASWSELTSAVAKPAAYIDGRSSQTLPNSPGRFPVFYVDVGQDVPVALVRVLVTEVDISVSELEWCRRGLMKLVREESARAALEGGDIQLLPNDGDMHTLDELISQLRLAVTLPKGISAHLRQD